MGYYSNVGLAMRKNDRDAFLSELMKNDDYHKYYFCDCFTDENGNFTEDQKYVACETREVNCVNNLIIKIFIPEIKWYDIEELFYAFMRNRKAPYKLVRIGEDIDDCEEILYFDGENEDEEEFFYKYLFNSVELVHKINFD